MFKKFAVALTCSFIALSASAATKTVTDSVPGLLESYGADGWTSDNVSLGKSQSFSDAISFEIGSLSDVSYGYTLTTFNGKNMAVDYFTLSGDGVNITVDSGDLSSYVFSKLNAGSYVFTLFGHATGATGGKFSVTLGATPAVPEPESIALAMAGLGVVGFLARRRQTV